MNNPKTKEQEEQILLRKHRDTLYISGNGIMVFGAWSLIQSFFYATILQQELKDMVGLESNYPEGLLYIVMFVLVAIEIAFRLYIGFSARAVSKGKKKSPAYLVTCILVTLYYLFILIENISDPSRYGILRYIITIILDLTSLYIHVEVVYAGIKVRKILRSDHAD